MVVKTDKNVYIIIETEKSDDQYTTYAYNFEGEKLGYASFTTWVDSEIWLYQVKTFEPFRNQGIGSTLLDFVSYYSAKLNYDHIAGKFSPTSEHAREFYFKNGYGIYEEDNYNRLEKKINKEEIMENMEKKYHIASTKQNDKKIGRASCRERV